MRSIASPFFSGGAIAVLLAAAGDLILWRGSEWLEEAVESFLVGLSAAAAALFPLSLLAGPGCLNIVRYALVGAGLSRLFLSRRLRKGRARAGASRNASAVTVGLVAVLVAVVGLFTLRTLWNGLGWDGIHVWAAKAKVLFVTGRLTPHLWVTPDVADRDVLYPPALPLMEALVVHPGRPFDFMDAKGAIPVFFVALVVSVFGLTRRFASNNVALVTAIGAATIPTLLDYGMQGYCDLPLAAYLAAAFAAALAPRGSRASRSLPWLAGGLLMTKDEGIVLLLCGAAVFVVSRDLAPRFSRAGFAIVGAFLLDREAYRFWTGAHDRVYGPIDAAHLRAVPGRLYPVASLCLREMLHLPAWGVFWPIFLAAALATLGRRNSGAPRALAAFVLLAVGAYAAIYLFTNLDLTYHVTHSYTRLLLQVAPVGAAAIAAVWTQWRTA